MPDPFIPYAKQSIGEDDVRAVVDALKSDFLTTGPRVEAFEKALCARTGAKYAAVCSSGTAALHLAAAALGLGPGDLAVTSPITFLASANCARFTGAGVVFSDVEPGTVNLDAARLRDTLRERKGAVKAVVAVDYAGHPADLEAIAKAAKEFGARVIEDASHAIGASYNGVPGVPGTSGTAAGSCAHADLAVFSFHPVKHVTTGEGGAVLTNDKALYDKIVLLRSHGMVRNPASPWAYEMSEIGFNYRITDIQCALGLSQLAKLDGFLERRRAAAAEYRKALAGSALVRPLEEKPGVRHAYHLFPVRIDFKKAGTTREKTILALKEKGVGTQVHYIPVHLQPYYRRHSATGEGDFPHAETFYAEALSLPMYADLPAGAPSRVAKALFEVLGEKK